jgi:hypothetical protein
MAVSPCLKKLALMAASKARHSQGDWINPLESFRCGAESAVMMDRPGHYLVRRGTDGGVISLTRSTPDDAGDMLYQYYRMEFGGAPDDYFSDEEEDRLHVLTGLSHADTWG